MVTIKYFSSKEEVDRYFPNGVPSTVIAVVGNNESVVMGKSNNNPYSDTVDTPVEIGGGNGSGDGVSVPDISNDIVECFANILTGHFFQFPYQLVNSSAEMSGDPLDLKWYYNNSILDAYGKSNTGLLALPLLTGQVAPSQGSYPISEYNSDNYSALRDYIIIGMNRQWQDVYFTSFEMPEDMVSDEDYLDYMLCGDAEDNVILTKVNLSEFMTTKFPLVYFCGPRWAADIAISEFTQLREQLMPTPDPTPGLSSEYYTSLYTTQDGLALYVYDSETNNYIYFEDLDSITEVGLILINKGIVDVSAFNQLGITFTTTPEGRKILQYIDLHPTQSQVTVTINNLAPQGSFDNGQYTVIFSNISV